MEGFDSRFQVNKEWTGAPTVKYVVRFEGVWIMSFISPTDALKFARDESNNEMMIRIYYEVTKRS